MNSGAGTGSIANQRFEAERHVHRLLKIITRTKSNKDTRRWKEEAPMPILRKPDGKKKLSNKYVERSNIFMSERIYDIMHQKRQATTVEYLPGFRISKNGGGTVIDCYKTEMHDSDKFKTMHGREFECHVTEKKQEAKNAILYGHIRNATSQYDAGKLAKQYNDNRHMARVLLNKVPQTTVHLGLLKAAKEKERKLLQTKLLRSRVGGREGGGDATVDVPGYLGGTGWAISEVDAEERAKEGIELNGMHYTNVDLASKVVLNTSHLGYYKSTQEVITAQKNIKLATAGPDRLAEAAEEKKKEEEDEQVKRSRSPSRTAASLLLSRSASQRSSLLKSAGRGRTTSPSAAITTTTLSSTASGLATTTKESLQREDYSGTGDYILSSSPTSGRVRRPQSAISERAPFLGDAKSQSRRALQSSSTLHINTARSAAIESPSSRSPSFRDLVLRKNITLFEENGAVIEDDEESDNEDANYLYRKMPVYGPAINFDAAVGILSTSPLDNHRPRSMDDHRPRTADPFSSSLSYVAAQLSPGDMTGEHSSSPQLLRGEHSSSPTLTRAQTAPAQLSLSIAEADSLKSYVHNFPVRAATNTVLSTSQTINGVEPPELHGMDIQSMLSGVGRRSRLSGSGERQLLRPPTISVPEARRRAIEAFDLEGNGTLLIGENNMNVVVNDAPGQVYQSDHTSTHAHTVRNKNYGVGGSNTPTDANIDAKMRGEITGHRPRTTGGGAQRTAPSSSSATTAPRPRTSSSSAASARWRSKWTGLPSTVAYADERFVGPAWNDTQSPTYRFGQRGKDRYDIHLESRLPGPGGHYPVVGIEEDSVEYALESSSLDFGGSDGDGGGGGSMSGGTIPIDVVHPRLSTEFMAQGLERRVGTLFGYSDGRYTNHNHDNDRGSCVVTTGGSGVDDDGDDGNIDIDGVGGDTYDDSLGSRDGGGGDGGGGVLSFTARGSASNGEGFVELGGALETSQSELPGPPISALAVLGSSGNHPAVRRSSGGAGGGAGAGHRPPPLMTNNEDHHGGNTSTNNDHNHNKNDGSLLLPLFSSNPSSSNENTGRNSSYNQSPASLFRAAKSASAIVPGSTTTAVGTTTNTTSAVAGGGGVRSVLRKTASSAISTNKQEERQQRQQQLQQRQAGFSVPSGSESYNYDIVEIKGRRGGKIRIAQELLIRGGSSSIGGGGNSSGGGGGGGGSSSLKLAVAVVDKKLLANNGEHQQQQQQRHAGGGNGGGASGGGAIGDVHVYRTAQGGLTLATAKDVEEERRNHEKHSVKQQQQSNNRTSSASAAMIRQAANGKPPAGGALQLLRPPTSLSSNNAHTDSGRLPDYSTKKPSSSHQTNRGGNERPATAATRDDDQPYDGGDGNDEQPSFIDFQGGYISEDRVLLSEDGTVLSSSQPPVGNGSTILDTTSSSSSHFVLSGNGHFMDPIQTFM